MAEVLHGNVFMAGSKFLGKSKTGPKIDDISIKPIGPGVDEPVSTEYSRRKYRKESRRRTCGGNCLLRRALKGLNIRETTTIVVSYRFRGWWDRQLSLRQGKRRHKKSGRNLLDYPCEEQGRSSSVVVPVTTHSTVILQSPWQNRPHVAVGTLRRLRNK